MRNERGFTLLELLVVVGVAGVLAAVALPGMQVALQRNRVITSSELVGATFREARLAAITRNAAFQVRFNCPANGAIRFVAVTGNSAIDGAANRCELTQPNDGPAIYMPAGVGFGGDAPPVFNINGRGQISVSGGAMPSTLPVTYGSYTRTLTITASGRVRTPTN